MDTANGVTSKVIEWRSRTRLVDEVAQELRERIYAGVYPPGNILRQIKISEDLNISRTPLREALRLLEKEGLLASDVNGGVRVVCANHQQLMDAYAVREVLDGLAARRSAERCDEGAGRRLAAMIERQRQVVNEWSPGGYTMANVEFHAAIFELANNEYLTAQLPIVHMTSQVFTPAALLDKDRAERAVNEHSLIADAITRGDAKEAERLARQHIHTTIDDLQSVYIGRSQLDGEVAL